MAAKKILFVFTSADKTLTGRPTGWFLPEAAHPYCVLKDHCEIDFAAPKGPNPPVDGLSVHLFADEESVAFLKDSTVKTKLANALTLQDVDVKIYAAVFYVGGHGPVLDLAFDPINHKLVSDFYNSGKIVAGVCHGPSAFVEAKDTQGNSIVAGKRVTALSNDEEALGQGLDQVPFLIEDKLKELGGIYEKAPRPMAPCVVVTGQLITGQNPASSKPLGEAILKALS